MASRLRAAGAGPAGKAGGGDAADVSGLVDSIRKHKKFKQLASYSIQCLEKVVAPPRIGWEVNAKAAFEAGAAEDIADVCNRFASDPEVFSMSLSSLSAIAQVPKALASIVTSPAASLIVQAVGAFYSSVEWSSPSAASEVTTRMQPALDLLLSMARQDGGAFDKAGGIKLLLDIAAADARPAPGKSGPSAGQTAHAAMINTVCNILDRASRNKAGLDALLNPNYIAQLLKISATNLAADGKGGTFGSSDARAGYRRGGKRGGASRGGDSNTADLNAHLEPSFRILDRIARSDAGREMLLGAGATHVLANIMSVVARKTSIAQLAMRVFARLLGSNVADLVDRITGVRGSDVRERVLCSRLLAFMARDEEYMATLMANGGELVTRIIQQINTAPLDTTDAATALVQVLRRLADASSDYIAVLEERGALEQVIQILQARATDAEVVAEAVGFLASVIDCPEMVERVDTLQPMSGLRLALSAAAQHIASDAVGAACLQLLERSLFHEYNPDNFVGLGAINYILNAMRENVGDNHIQLLATDVLIYLATCERHVDYMVADNVIAVVIKNLLGNKTDDEEDDAGAARGDEEDAEGKDNKKDSGLSAELVASSLYLVTSLCAVSKHIPAAKEAGIIRAVLAGFSHHTQDANVYKYFREVISALDIEEAEVLQAIDQVARWTSILQSAADEAQDAFKFINDYVERMRSEGKEVFNGLPTWDAPQGEAIPKGPKGEPDLTGIAEKVLEGISLLEAVTVSPVFVCVISAYDGVPALLRTLAVVSLVKMVQEAGNKGAKGKVGAAAGAARFGGVGAATRTISFALADEVLSRTCNTLAHLGRVAYEIDGGQVEQDPEYEPIDFSEFAISAQLYDRDALAFVARAMLGAAKPQLRSFAVASITLMSWLASGHTHNDVRDHVDGIVSAQGIEGCVSMLRAHQSSVDICAAIAGALTRIAVSSRGATAVATRGGSRQIIRMLHPTAAMRTNPGDELLLAFLRLMDTCAAGGPESADILRRQGLVDAVVACVDAGTDRDFKGEDEDDGMAPTKTAKGSGAAGGEDKKAGASNYVPDPLVRADIDATITSILSRLVGPDMVRETVSTLNDLCAQIRDQTANGSHYDPRRGIQLGEYTRATLVRTVVRLGLLATTEAAVAAGQETLEAGAQACVTLAESALLVQKTLQSMGMAVTPGSLEHELEVALPSSIRTMRQVLNAMYMGGAASAGAGTAASVAAMPILFRALEENPNITSEVVATSAVLAANDKAAAAIPKVSGGRGLAMLVEVLRAAADRGDEAAVRDALLTLAGVARLPECLSQVIASGAPVLTHSFLAEAVNDAQADTLAASLLVLAHSAADPALLHDLVATGGVFEIIRIALQRHCMDPYSPREPLLYSIALLMQRLTFAPLVLSDPVQGEEYRNTVRRVLRAGAGSTGYIDSPRCACAVMDMITHGCVPGGSMPAAVAEANKEAVLATDGEDFIVHCMSSSAADDSVLASGYAALRAIGAADRANRLVADIDAYAARIPEWLAAGYDSNDPQIIDMMTAMGDCMRTLASQIVVQGGNVPDLGSRYSDVLATIWRAVAVVCRPDMVSRRSTAAAPQPTGQAGKDLHQSRADALAVGAQIAGRLLAASNAANEGPDGDHAISLSDLVSVLYTILAAGHSVLEVRVVESIGRAAEQVVESMGEAGLHQLCTGKVIAGFISLLQVVQSETAKARLATAGGTMAGDYDATLSLADLGKCEAAITSALKNITSKARSVLNNMKTADSALVNDPDSLADVLKSAAITTMPAANAPVTTTEGEDGEEKPAPAVFEEAPTSDLALLADSIVNVAAKAGGAAPAFALLLHTANTIAADIYGPALHAPTNKAPLYTVTTLQACARTQAAVIRAIAARVAPGAVAPAGGVAAEPGATVFTAFPEALTALFAATAAGLDVSLDNGGKGRKTADKSGAYTEPVLADTAEYEPTEAELNAAKAAFSTASVVAASSVRAALDLLAHIESGSSIGADAVAQPAFTAALAFLFGSKDAVAGGAGLSAVRVTSRMSDLYAADVASGRATAAGARLTRIQKLAEAGVYRAAVNGLSVAGISDNELHVQAVVNMISKLLAMPPVDVKTLGLDKQSLLAMQAALRRFPDMAPQIIDIVAGLEKIYQEQSGAAFEASLKKSLHSLANTQGFYRHVTADGQMFYSKAETGETQWDPPAAVNAMMDALADVDLMSRRLEEEAVSVVSPDIISGLATVLQSHEHDPGVVGVALNAIGKLAANADNHAAIEANNLMQVAADIFTNNKHLDDPRVCEGLASMILPLSFDPVYVKTILTSANVIPILVEIIRKYNKYVTTYVGSSMTWPPENHPNYNQKLLAMKADGPDAEERNKEMPRLAQMCVQSLANLACDNEVDATGQSSVTRIVDCGGIEALGELMSLHEDSPRLLEDSICALSNMAFVSDTIQLAIGRSCMDTVCGAATNFNGDSYLFQMTLRAIGNLTRCDENIMRAVGYGVIRGMVEGMTKHIEDPSVLQLCADVIGNMASVDDKKVPRDLGVEILTECTQKRKVAAPAAPGAPPPPPGKGPAKPAPGAPAVPQLSLEAVMAIVDRTKSLKEAVCTILYEDGAPRGLVQAMTKHIRSPDLAGSCLRALHYIGASSELVTRMVNELALVDQVVYIMRSIDYRPDVLRRGARVLGLVVGTDNLKDRVLQAGAPVMLLQAIETHKAERELCISCYSVLAMSRSQAVVTAVQEMQAVDTAVSILRSNAGDHEFVGVLLELLWGWAAEADLATTIASRAGPVLVALLNVYATNTAVPDRLQHLIYILNLMIALVRQKVEVRLLLDVNLMAAMQAVANGIVASNDGGVMLQQRSLVMQVVTIILDMIKPPTGNKDIAPTVHKPNVEAVNAASAGPMLEAILNAYKAVPDPKVPGQLLYDQSMCEKVHGILQEMIACGYTPASPVTLDSPDNEDGGAAAPAAAAPAAAAPAAAAPVAAPPAAAPAAPSGPVLAPDAQAELTAMQGAGREVEVWHDGKPRKARLNVTPDRGTISITYLDTKKAEVQSLAAASVRGLLLNVPTNYKKKVIGRSAKPERCITLEDGAGAAIAHIETETDAQRQFLAVALGSLLTGVSPRMA